MTKQELQHIFESPFDWDNWRKVMDFVFPEFQYALQQQDIPLDTAQRKRDAKYIKQHGVTELSDGERIVLYEIALSEKVRLDRNVKSVRKLISSEVFTGYQIGLGIFHNEVKTKWRFTLVIREFTPAFTISDKKPESYTYVFGEGERGRTAAERFFELSKKTDKKLKDLEEAFSVEALSKKFFIQYKEIYKKFVDNIIENPSRLNLFKASTKEEQEKLAHDFVKKMMGRIVFLYFLQKKGWMGCKSKWLNGENLFMKKLFEASPQDGSFYLTYLEPLFFDTLNDKRENTDQDCVINGHPFGKVPFLNGGLFEREENHPDSLTLDWDLFRHLFEVFDTYNFTIIEDDPDFKEVAVDPEMLGHIFENLLEENRKKTGAFYTPKEIVQYMCQESLIEYLHTQLSKNIVDEELKETIRDFVVRQHFVGLNDLNQQSDKYVLQALRDIKVCDPAIGSGAFPMGILHEIFRMVEALEDRDIFQSIWEMDVWDAARVKEDIIQNSIYGVDIEKGAVDIARLRFWLSIIIDEEAPKPLPNLDYKIVVGDSLLNKFENLVIDIVWEVKEGRQTTPKSEEFLKKRSKLLQVISDKQKIYFDTESSNRVGLSREIKDLKIDILINQLEMKIEDDGIINEPKAHNFQKKINFAKAQKIYYQTLEWQEAINNLESIKGTNKTFNHFDWNLDFPEILNPIINKETKGFDLVIGNPPYVRQESIDPKWKSHYITKYPEVGSGTADLYVYFFDLSFSLTNRGGVINFITLNKFLKTKYGVGLRKKMQELTTDLVMDFFELPVFQASTDSAITKVINLKTEHISKYFPVKSLDNLDLRKITSGKFLHILKEGSEWKFIDLKSQSILDKIYLNSVSLKDFTNDKIFRGVVTGNNDVFVLKRDIAKELLKTNESQHIKKFIKSNSFNRWYLEESDSLLYIPWNFDLDKNPNIKNYLNNFYDKLSERPEVKEKRYSWYAMSRYGSKYYKYFDKPKLVYIYTAKRQEFYLDTEGHYINNNCYMVVSDNKYLFFYLNSVLFDWFKRIKFVAYGDAEEGGRVKLDYNKMITVPIKPISGEMLKKYEEMYDSIKYLNINGQNISEIERMVEVSIFKLYDLTYSEIKLIIDDFKLTEEEYNNFSLEDLNV